MAQAVQSKNAELFQTVYQNVKAAGDEVLNLMPSVKDEQLRSDMTVQLSVLEAFASRAAKHLAEEGEKPEEAGMLSKAVNKVETKIDTLRDSTAPHLAQMLIEGATKRGGEMMRALREAECGRASEAAIKLVRDVASYEEKIAQDYKSYL